MGLFPLPVVPPALSIFSIMAIFIGIPSLLHSRFLESSRNAAEERCVTTLKTAV